MSSPSSQNGVSMMGKSKYLLILAFIAGLILIVGWQIRPNKGGETQSQADITRLQRLTQRSNLDNMATYFLEVADRSKASLVWIDRLESTGIVWDNSSSILASASPNMARVTGQLRSTSEVELPMPTDLYSASPGFRVMKAPAEVALIPVQTAPAGALSQGSWLAAIHLTGRDSFEIEPSLYSGTRPVKCGSLDLRELLIGTAAASRTLGSGVFDLEGRLFGVILDCDGEPRVITAESLGKAVDRARAVDSQIQFRYGFLPSGMTEVEQEYFGTAKGMLIREVWRDSSAWTLGLRPGDVIVALDKEPIEDLEDLNVMTLPMYRPAYTLTTRRGRTERSVTFPPGIGLQIGEPKSDEAPVVLASLNQGEVVQSITPGSAAARAGMLLGDRVVSVGPGFSPSKTEIDPSLLGGETPTFVVVERLHALRGLFLE